MADETLCYRTFRIFQSKVDGNGFENGMNWFHFKFVKQNKWRRGFEETEGEEKFKIRSVKNLEL